MASNFLVVIFKPYSKRKSWISHANIVVTLLLDNAGKIYKPVAYFYSVASELAELYD